MNRWLSHIALCLLAVMSLNILAIPLTYLDFTLRQDYYANVLCQNQDQPIAVCGGRCFIDKQVAMLQPVTPRSPESAPVAPTLEIDLSVYIAFSHSFSILLRYPSNLVNYSDILEFITVDYLCSPSLAPKIM